MNDSSNSIAPQYVTESALETWIAYFGNTEDSLMCIAGATPEEARTRLIERLRSLNGLGASVDVDAWEILLHSEPANTWTQHEARLDDNAPDAVRIVADHGFQPPETITSSATGKTGTLKVRGHAEAVQRRIVAWCERDAAAQGKDLPRDWNELDYKGKTSAYFARGLFEANLVTHPF